MGLLSSVVGLNPYGLIAGAVVVAAVSGTIYGQSVEIHSWHSKYDQRVLDEDKQIAARDAIINDMIQTQAKQDQETAKAINAIVNTPPTTQTVVKTIHDAPVAKECTTPALQTLKDNT